MNRYIVETQRDGQPWSRLEAYANEAIAIRCAEAARMSARMAAPGCCLLPRYDAVRVRRGQDVIWRTVPREAS